MTEPVEHLNARALREKNEALERELQSLRIGGGGGTLPPMETVDAKISASEARTDTKFAELRSDLKDFASKATVWKGVASTVAAIFTAMGVILAVMAYGGDRFDAGVGAGGALAPYAAEQKFRDDAQDRKLDLILERLPAPQPSGSPKP